MGLSAYGFALFIFVLLCLLAFLCKQLFTDNKGKGVMLEEKEKKLLRLYSTLEDTMDDFTDSVVATHKDMDKKIKELRQLALSVQHSISAQAERVAEARTAPTPPLPPSFFETPPPQPVAAAPRQPAAEIKPEPREPVVEQKADPAPVAEQKAEPAPKKPAAKPKAKAAEKKAAAKKEEPAKAAPAAATPAAPEVAAAVMPEAAAPAAAQPVEPAPVQPAPAAPVEPSAPVNPPAEPKSAQKSSIASRAAATSERAGKILALAEQGYDRVHIAKELSVTLSEIDLVLGISKQKK